MNPSQKNGRWQLPAGVLGGGGVVGSLGAATYTGHVPLGVAILVISVTGVLMLLTTLITTVMPQQSEHRNESIQAFLEHRRKMTVLKQKARGAAQPDANLAVPVVPAPQAASNLSRASTPTPPTAPPASTSTTPGACSPGAQGTVTQDLVRPTVRRPRPHRMT